MALGLGFSSAKLDSAYLYSLHCKVFIFTDRFNSFNLLVNLIQKTKVAAGHIRHYRAADNGFPSDHTLLSSSIAVTIFSAHKKLGLVLFVLVLLDGLSRVIGHIHSLIDIIGSVVFTFVGASVAYWLTPKVVSKFTL